MTRVICSNYDCLHIDPKSCYCQKDVISVGEDYTYGCDDYISYLDSDEYREKFFKAVRTRDGKKAKAVDYGKKIEYNGRVFYTKDRASDDESYGLTDGRTGLLLRPLAWLKDNYDRFLELEKKEPDVESLPLAVKVGGKYMLVGTCTGKGCPMQVGYQTDSCDNKECPYRTEVQG